MDRQTYEDLARRIRGLAPRAGDTRVIAIDGPAGSGKTSFARRLASALDAPVLHLDDLCPGWDGLDEAPARLVDWVLEPLATDGLARYRRYDWDAERYQEWHDIPAAPALIVEGVGTGSRIAAPYLSLLVWVTAPLDLRMARGTERDGEVSRERWETWARRENELFAREGIQERADLRVNGAAAIAHDPEREFATS